MHIRKEFFRFVIPSMLAFALSGVYAIADGFFVGNAMGDDVLAAVNIAYPLTAFLQAVGTGVGMGGAIEYAINAGNQNENRGRQYMGMAILLLGGFSILFTALFLLAGPQILGLFGASGEILEYSSEYLRFVSYGAVFQIAGTGLVPFIRNMGGAVTAMAAMVTGFITNIVLDYLFVWVLPWGMMGAAVATAIGQAMTFLVCLVFFILKKHAPSFRFDGDGGYLASRILGVGLSPFGLTYSPNITLILLNKSAVTFGGNLAVTCYAPISYISAVVMLLMQGVSRSSAWPTGRASTLSQKQCAIWRIGLPLRLRLSAQSSCSCCGAARPICSAPPSRWRRLWRRPCRSSLSALSLSACPG